MTGTRGVVRPRRYLAIAGVLATLASMMACQQPVPPTPPIASVFTEVTPCRAVDTRGTLSGRLPANGWRAFQISGSGLAGQGGVADCGVPDGAFAVEVSITVVSPQGPGFVRVVPNDGVEAKGVVIGFDSGVDLVKPGTVRLAPSKVQDLVVRSFDASIHVTIDVLGFHAGMPPAAPVGSTVRICEQLAAAPAASTVVVPAGDHDLGDCYVNGQLRAGVDVQAEFPPGGPVSRLIGMFECTDCEGWLFDGIHVRGDAPDVFDPAYTVRMIRGSGWRWTRCNLSNGVGPDGKLYGVRGVFTTFGAVRDWQIDNCTVHSNGSSAPNLPNSNLDHLVYINAFPSVTRSNGFIGPNNIFYGNSSGAPVKVGFGIDNGAPVGVRGVTVTSNHIHGNSSPDGNCGVLVSGSSPETQVVANRIDCTETPEEHTRNAVAIRDWVFNDAVTVQDNIVSGARAAGAPTGCGTASAFGVDQTVTVISHFPFAGNWQINPQSCSFFGVTTARNVTTPD